MKKFKKFAIGVMNLSFVLVPVILLTCGLHLATGPVWDVAMLAGCVLIWWVAINKYRQVRKGKEQLGQAQAIVAITGIFSAFLPLALQLIFCNGISQVPCEASIAWMFIVGTVAGVKNLYHDRPELKSIAASMAFGLGFIGICAVGCTLELFEHFSGLEMPQRIYDVLGVLVPICAVGCILFFIIGLVQDRTAKR